MSVCVVLAQFDSLVTRMESFSSRLSAKKIRPTRDQLNEFQNLHIRFKNILADYENSIERLLTAGLPDENDISIAGRVRSDKYSRLVDSSTLTTLKRNMILIFAGPKTSRLDSSQVKTKNKQTESRCGNLRSQHSHVILLWAMALQPSAWRTSGGMTDKTFYFLIDDLQEERMKQIPRKISETLQALAEEEPLNTSGSFKTFIEDVQKSTVDQEEVAGTRTTLKRKRIALPNFSRQYALADEDKRRGNSTNSEFSRNATSDMSKIQGGRQIDYRCSASPIAKLPMLGDRLFIALQSSHQWQWERRVGETGTSDCLNVLVPKNRDQDVSVNLLVGHESGLRLIHELEAIRV